MEDNDEVFCRTNIALIGFMGAGKTTVGKFLSYKTKMSHIDSDEEVEKISKMPIPMIFQKYGDRHLRLLEQDFCSGILPTLTNTVISTGGGIILNQKNIEMLRLYSKVFYIKSSPQKLYSRLKDDISRPLLQTYDKMDAIKTLLADREPLYEICAHHVINTGELEVFKIAEIILSII